MGRDGPNSFAQSLCQLVSLISWLTVRILLTWAQLTICVMMSWNEEARSKILNYVGFEFQWSLVIVPVKQWILQEQPSGVELLHLRWLLVAESWERHKQSWYYVTMRTQKLTSLIIPKYKHWNHLVTTQINLWNHLLHFPPQNSYPTSSSARLAWLLFWHSLHSVPAITLSGPPVVLDWMVGCLKWWDW